MASQEIFIDQSSLDLLASEKPLRIVVLLRQGSPLYSNNLVAPWEGVVVAVSSTLNIHQDRAKLMVVQKYNRLIVFALDFHHHEYDWATAHNPVDLPVVVIDYGKTKTFVKGVGRPFRSRVNKYVAEQHNLHGWQAHPPYFEDQSRTRNGVPTYLSPRDLAPRPPPSAVLSANSTIHGTGES